MKDTRKKKTIRESLQESTREVNSWPEWKQKLARSQDFKELHKPVINCAENVYPSLQKKLN